jgi:23S rRNA (adenine2503-C2)-methyltransferase
MEARNILDMTVRELGLALREYGYPEYRSKQVFGWLYKGIGLREMKNLPQELKNRLDEDFVTGIPEIIKKQVSEIDGTTKYLVKYYDGSMVECVYLIYEYGRTACISSQVGCRMGCSFCASTRGGLIRNLSPGEMTGQVLAIQRDAKTRISNVVIMGSGEPLDNYQNTLRFIRQLNSRDGLNIGLRSVTLSTCGLVPEIKKLAEEGLPITLSISLHGASDETRMRLMPVAGKYKTDEIVECCKYYIKRTGRRITFEYALVEGINNRPEDAKKLAALLKGMLCNVNLIPVNPVEGTGYKQPGAGKVKRFKQMLERAGISVTIRREMGRDIDGACGQLKAGYIEEKNL